MDKQKVKQRIEKLKKEVNRYRHAYHVENRSLIADEALDSLKKELFDLETVYPDLVTPDSPTQRIGGKPAKLFRKVRHKQRMLSFVDAFSREDMTAWVERMRNFLGRGVEPTFYVELKIDGFGIELVYENGILVQASTRGDGMVGEDVTENVRTIEAIPLNITDIAKVPVPEKLIVRGEVFITKEEFSRINQEQEKRGEKTYANPRNIAAGSIRQLDPKVTAARRLDACLYVVVTDLGQKTHAAEHALLSKLGFKTANQYNRKAESLAQVFAYRDKWEKERDRLPFQIDGVVVVVDDNDLYGELGIVGKAPRGAIAYKFSPEETTTKVRDIKVQVGRTGALTPVAVLEPVEVGGVTIEHATLHNFDQIERLDVRVGDTVIVSRAGDVIPQVTAVLAKLRTGKEKKFKVPLTCPIDGSPIVKEKAISRCSNPDCGARLRERLGHFVSRAAFDIQGLGQKVLSRFVDEGFVTDFADIFRLNQGEIAILEGFGEKSAAKIVAEVKESREVELARFIYALGIFHVGEETAYMLSGELIKLGMRVGKPSDLAKTLGSFSEAELMRFPDVGPKVAESIGGWFNEPGHQKLLKEMDEVGVKIRVNPKEPTSAKLAGQSFVLTGSLQSLSREEAERRIRKLGGNPTTTVSRQTDYVVAGIDPGGKLVKARELGVKVIDEKTFLAMLE